MTAFFEHGYALVIGVDANQIPRLALPAVAKDVQAVYDVLVHPQRCAYKPENVRLIKGDQSTRDNILDGLYWLQAKVREDAEATAVIYYSGHGWVDEAANQYYLIPYNITELSRVRTYSIRAEDFATEIDDLPARRMLAILDCCHAGGMGVKDVDLEAINQSGNAEAAAFPLDTSLTKDIPSFDAEPGAKNFTDLLNGEGRAVLNSSTGAQSSYVRPDQKMSIFTYHLIEALTGHASLPDAEVVNVADVMSWVTNKVQQSAGTLKLAQTPVMRTTGVFPIALVIGGQGIAKGMGGILPEPLEPLPLVARGISGNTAGGDMTNIVGDVEQIGDNVTIGAGSEYVRGNQTIHGSQVGGDQISVGNISGSQGIAIGRASSASVQITQGPTMDELTPLFAPLLAQAARENQAAVAQLQALKAEVAKGEAAADDKMAGLIEGIAAAAPSLVEAIVNLFTNSIVAKVAGGATNYVLKRLRK